MNVPDRLAKLHRLADHPTTNPHEAARAREEIARLEREHGGVVVASRRFTGTEFDDIMQAWAGMGDRAAEEIVRANRAEWERWERERAERNRRGIYHPGDDGYRKWASNLTVGDSVRLHRDDVPFWAPVPPPLSAEPLRIVRMTRTQYVMSDGTRFRRTGQYPGGKVGETGREGYRTHIIATGVAGTSRDG